MNAGVISSRYAKALLKFVQETGNGVVVYAQVGVLLMRMKDIAQLADYVENHDEIPVEKKLHLLDAALGEEMSVELRHFVALVHGRRRMQFFVRMLYSFVGQYRDMYNIKVGTLVTALPVDGLQEKMETLLRNSTGSDVHIEMSVNPEIIGGFVFRMDDLRLDASVASQFRKIRRQLIDKNNRIV